MFDFDVSAHGFIIFGFLSILSVINYRGIRESTWVNVASTLISVAALLVIAFAGMAAWGRAQPFEVIPPEGAEVYALLIVVASALAFYAYIGFEDICNVAEEVKDPERTILRATMLAVAITTVLYLLIGLTVISVAASDVPLALVARRLLPSLPSGWIHVVALFAILYGLARDGLLPKRFGRISDERQTPIVGVMFAFALAFIVAVTGFLRFLAEATSVILLSAFFLVNAALIVVKVRRIPSDNPKIEPFDVPMFVPLLGLATTGYLVVQFSAGAYLRLGLLMGFGLALYGFQRLGLRLSAPGSKLV